MSTAASVFGCALRRLIVTLLVVAASPPAGAFAQFDTWTSVGPDGGAVQALAVHPTTPDVLYAGGVNGLFKSVDGGGTWWRAEAGLGSRTIGSLAVLPSSEVFAGTAAGLYVSHDAGETWALVNTLPAGPVTAVAADANGSRVYVAFSGEIFTSVNGGTSWTPGNVLVFASIVALAVNPANPAIAYGLAGTSVLKTVNGGDTWSAVVAFTLSARSLAIDPLAPDTVYAITSALAPSPIPGQSTRVSDLHKTTNGGTNWIRIVDLTAIEFNVVTTHRGVAGTVFLGTEAGVRKSVDGGTTWSAVNFDRTLALASHPTAHDTLFAGTELRGVFKSIDAGSGWTPATSGITLTDVEALVIDPSNPLVLYAVSRGVGVYKSVNGGSTWFESSTGVNGFPLRNTRGLAINPVDPRIVYVAGAVQGRSPPLLGSFDRSTDGGATWHPIVSGVPGWYLSALAIDPHSGSDLYATFAAGTLLYKSTDWGLTWGGVFTFPQGITALAADPVVAGRLYAGSLTSGAGTIYRSLDHGASWTPLATPGVDYITSIAVDPLTPTTIYAVTSHGLIKTVDGGATWSASGFSGTVLTAFQIAPLAPSTLYAGTSNSGVYRSLDGGASWQPFNAGLTSTTVTSLAVPRSAQPRVYAGSRGASVSVLTSPAPSGDDDARADLAVYRETTGQWFIHRSADGSVVTTTFGAPSLDDVPVPGDFDGDGRRDLAVYRRATGQWFILRSSDGGILAVPFGAPSLQDVPIPRDFDGDGRTDLAVYRQSTGQWFIARSTLGFVGPIAFGAPHLGDVPVPADYDGDGAADVAVFRRTTGEWFIFGSTSGFVGPLQFGGALDVPVPADYDGDGRADLAVFREPTADWFIFGSTAGFIGVRWGDSSLGDRPVPADYDGDGRTDIAVFREATGQWHIRNSATGGLTVATFGRGGDRPTVFPR